MNSYKISCIGFLLAAIFISLFLSGMPFLVSNHPAKIQGSMMEGLTGAAPALALAPAQVKSASAPASAQVKSAPAPAPAQTPAQSVNR